MDGFQTDEKRILSVCTKRLSAAATKLRQDRYIATKKGLCMKTAMFEELWRGYHNSWVTRLQDSSECNALSQTSSNWVAASIFERGLPRVAKVCDRYLFPTYD
jgi:hypothetical protein